MISSLERRKPVHWRNRPGKAMDARRKMTTTNQPRNRTKIKRINPWTDVSRALLVGNRVCCFSFLLLTYSYVRYCYFCYFREHLFFKNANLMHQKQKKISVMIYKIKTMKDREDIWLIISRRYRANPFLQIEDDLFCKKINEHYVQSNQKCDHIVFIHSLFTSFPTAW